MVSLRALQCSKGQGRAFYNPHWLPEYHAQSALICAKYTSNGYYSANQAELFTLINNSFGAVLTLSAANAYETLINISGSGWLGWVMTATCMVNNQTHTEYIKFTVDGKEHEYSREFTEPATAVGVRALLGSPMQNGPAYLTSAGYTGYAGNAQDYGFTGLSDDSTAYVMMLNQTEQLMTIGGATLRFERSLKIEIKTSVLAASSQHKTVACDYVLEG